MSTFAGRCNSDGSPLSSPGISSGQVAYWTGLFTCPGSVPQTLLKLGGWCALGSGDGAAQVRFALYNAAGQKVVEGAAAINAPGSAAWADHTTFTWHIGTTLTNGDDYRIAAYIGGDQGATALIGNGYYTDQGSDGGYKGAVNYLGGFPSTLPAQDGAANMAPLRIEVEDVPGTPAPTISSITPNSIPVNDTTHLVIAGTGFSAGLLGGDAEVATDDAEVTITSVDVQSDIRIECDAVASGSAVAGALDITVETDGGVSTPFTISKNSANAPTLSAISPVSQHSNDTAAVYLDIELDGTDLDAGSEDLVISDPDVSLVAATLNPVSGILAQARLKIEPGFSGTVQIQYQTSEGLSNAVELIVIPPGASGGVGDSSMQEEYIQFDPDGTAEIIHRVWLKGSDGKGITGLLNTSDGLVIKELLSDGAAIVYDGDSGDIETITTLQAFEAPSSGKIRFKAVSDGQYEIHPDPAGYDVQRDRTFLFSGAGIAGEQGLIVHARDLATVQKVVNGMDELAPSAGTPAAGSFGERVNEIKAKTDGLNFTDTDVKATLDSETVALTNASLAAANLAADMNVYEAFVKLVDDNANDRDIWGVFWKKNGTVLNSGITDLKIRVYDHEDNDIIGSVGTPEDLTEIGSSHRFAYVATSAERIAGGLLYCAELIATIDGSPRSCPKWVSRDSPEA